MLVWEKYEISEAGTLAEVNLAIGSATSLRDEAYWRRVRKFLIDAREKEYSEFTVKQRNWMFSILADLGKMKNEKLRNRNL